MIDQAKPEPLEKFIDDRLRELFPSKPSLAPDFDQRVMERVRSAAVKSAQRRRRGLIMMTYWVFFGLFAGWMIAGTVSLNPETSGTAMSGLSLALALVILSILILGHQSRLKISQLFFRTVI